MKYSDKQRIEKILEYAEELMRYVEENRIDIKNIDDDRLIQWAVTTPLYNIGEHSYNLTQEFKDNTPQIQWNMIAGLRHRLVHDYEGTNWEVIRSIICDEIPELIKQLKQLQENQ